MPFRKAAAPAETESNVSSMAALALGLDNHRKQKQKHSHTHTHTLTPCSTTLTPSRYTFRYTKATCKCNDPTDPAPHPSILPLSLRSCKTCTWQNHPARHLIITTSVAACALVELVPYPGRGGRSDRAGKDHRARVQARAAAGACSPGESWETMASRWVR